MFKVSVHHNSQHVTWTTTPNIAVSYGAKTLYDNVSTVAFPFFLFI